MQYPVERPQKLREEGVIFQDLFPACTLCISRHKLHHSHKLHWHGPNSEPSPGQLETSHRSLGPLQSTMQFCVCPRRDAEANCQSWKRKAELQCGLVYTIFLPTFDLLEWTTCWMILGCILLPMLSQVFVFPVGKIFFHMT